MNIKNFASKIGNDFFHVHAQSLRFVCMCISHAKVDRGMVEEDLVVVVRM